MIILTNEELILRIKNIENQFHSLAGCQRSHTSEADTNISEAKASTEELKRSTLESSSLLEEALCDIDTLASSRLDDIEEALCELSELLPIDKEDK